MHKYPVTAISWLAAWTLVLIAAPRLAGQTAHYRATAQRQIIQHRGNQARNYHALPAYFQVQASAVNDPRGLAYQIKVTAKSGWGQTLTNFTGVARFASSDNSAMVSNTGPVNEYQYQFTAGDDGSHVFSILILSAKLGDIITVTGPNGMSGQSAPLGESSNDDLQAFAQAPGEPAQVGVGFPVVLTARAPSGQTDRGYTGTVNITSVSDSKAAMQDGTPLPAGYTFTSDVGVTSGGGGYQDQNPDDGRANLTIIPGTLGQQTYTFTDANSGQSTVININVQPAPPPPAAPAQIWQLIQEHQPNPPQSQALYEFGQTAMAYDAAARELILLGEANSSGVIWLSHDDGHSWTQACGAPGLVGASLAYDDATHQAMIFGGLNADGLGAMAATLMSQPSGCFQQISSATTPSARAWASLAYDPGSKQLVLWGGTGSHGGVWSWNGRNWTRHDARGPAPREGAFFAWDGNSHKLLMFGGWDGQNTDYQDTWELDTARWTWQRMNPAHQPTPRHYGEMQWDAGFQGDLLFGGAAGPLFTNTGNIGEQQFNDTWLWTGQDWRELQSSYISANANGQPGGRDDAAMAYDSNSGKLVLEGGSELLPPGVNMSGFAVQGKNCGGCISTPEAPQGYANSGTPAPNGAGIQLQPVEVSLDDTWNLPAPAGGGSQPALGFRRRKIVPMKLVQNQAPAAQPAAKMPFRLPVATRQPIPRHVPYRTMPTLTAAELKVWPARYVGPCPAKFRLTLTLSASHAEVMFYRVQFGGAPASPLYRLPFTQAGQQTVVMPWTVTRPGYAWAKIAVTSPIIAFSNLAGVEAFCH